MSSHCLEDLRRPPEYQQARAHVFPSRGSIEWYIRVHRDKLLRAKALLKVGGQVFVHAERFDAFVLDGSPGDRP